MAARWLMRVASDPCHGAGHLSRSRSLATALAGYAPVTVALDAGTTPPDCFAHSGVSVVTAGTEGMGPWLGVVLDGYDLPPSEIEALSACAKPLVVMDDFLNPPEAADLVINAAIGLTGGAVRSVPALLGPAYACLDARFARPSDRPIDRAVSRVVVSLGMADPENVTEDVLEAFSCLRGDAIAPEVVVVLGANAPHLESVGHRIAAMPDTELRVDVRDMAALLRSCDLAVGAGGVSLFERLALGVPSITLTIAENQRLFVEGAVAEGATVNGGTPYEGSEPGLAAPLAAVIRSVIEERNLRAALRDAGRRIVDGRGAERVAAHLNELAQSPRV